MALTQSCFNLLRPLAVTGHMTYALINGAEPLLVVDVLGVLTNAPAGPNTSPLRLRCADASLEQLKPSASPVRGAWGPTSGAEVLAAGTYQRMMEDKHWVIINEASLHLSVSDFVFIEKRILKKKKIIQNVLTLYSRGSPESGRASKMSTSYTENPQRTDGEKVWGEEKIPLRSTKVSQRNGDAVSHRNQDSNTQLAWCLLF